MQSADFAWNLSAPGAGYAEDVQFPSELYVSSEIVVSQPERAELLAAFLSQAAFIESLSYPAIAKYHLNKNRHQNEQTPVAPPTEKGIHRAEVL